MVATVKDSMTTDPTTIAADQSVHEAAELMRNQDIGALVVVDGERVAGVVTDRDIVVRIIATGGSPNTEERQACSDEVVTLSPDDPIRDAVQIMRDRAVRRIPVVSGNDLVGIVSIGDLAIDYDSDSALADISAEEPNT